jgi:hypothetical protein
MRFARGPAALAVIAALAALPASAGAELTFNLPAQIFKVFDESAQTAVDPNRCDGIVFVEFPKIKHAVSYRITVSKDGASEDFVAPPFDLFGRGFIARFPPPKAFARFFVEAFSTGEGCAAADAQTENAKIAEAKVSLDKQFQKRFNRILRPPWKPAYKPGRKRTYKPGEKRVKLRPWWSGDRRVVIVRRAGRVTTVDEGDKLSVNLSTNRYAVSGTTVKTGPNSIVQIGALNGGSVLVGPNVTLQITGEGFDVLEEPFPVKPWTVPRRSGPDYKVRTDNAVLSARG